MTSTTRGSRTGEDGATLVELSLVAVLVFVTIFALIEYGLLLRDNLNATGAVADATRIGGVVGPGVTPEGANADFQIVKTVREGLSSMSDADVGYVVVFKASGSDIAADDQLPQACKRGIPVDGICNVYPAAPAFAAAQSGDYPYFACDGDGPACAWDPTTRRDGTNDTPIDDLGVYVRIDRDGFTGLFADTWTITRAQTTRLEPGNIE